MIYDKNRGYAFTSQLASSVKAPEVACKDQSLAGNVRYFSESTSGRLFFNTRKHFKPSRQYSRFNAAGDYFAALFNDLIARQVLSQIAFLQSKPEQWTGDSSDKIIHLIAKKIKQRLADDWDMYQLHNLCECWHRNVNKIDMEKPLKLFSLEPLISPTCIDGIQIEAITSTFGLKMHGKTMDHCVDGYARDCLSSNTNILMLSDSSKSCSTLEISINTEEGGYIYEIKQHRAYENAQPNIEHSNGARTLVKLMNAGNVSINSKRLVEKKESAKDFIGYDISDLKTQEMIYQIYKSHKVLPKKLIADNYKEMLNNLALRELIDEEIMQFNQDIDIDKSAFELRRSF